MESMEMFLSLMVGIVAVPLIQLIKGWLKLDGKWALVLTAAVSVVLALVGLFLYGKVTLADFNWAELPEVFGLVFSTATVVYKLILSKE